MPSELNILTLACHIASRPFSASLALSYFGCMKLMFALEAMLWPMWILHATLAPLATVMSSFVRAGCPNEAFARSPLSNPTASAVLVVIHNQVRKPEGWP